MSSGPREMERRQGASIIIFSWEAFISNRATLVTHSLSPSVTFNFVATSAILAMSTRR